MNMIKKRRKSSADMRFKDRKDAGRQLAEALVEAMPGIASTDTVVYALPRGGVVLGREVADALKLPLDIAIARKIGHPENPEYAVCAVGEGGALICDEAERRALPEDWLVAEVERQRVEAVRRRALYGAGRAHLSPHNKVAIVVDDGIATGLTLRTALAELRREGPKKVVVAVPCAPAEIAAQLQKDVDELIVLAGEDRYLGAVGAYYDDFPQVSDEEVVRLLAS